MPADTAAPGPEQAYFDALADGRFMLQHCNACGENVFYPRALCPHCGADALVWREASGRGTVHATSVVRRRPEQGPPYNVALIDLEEGPRMMSRVETIAPEAVRIGMAVTAVIDRSGDDPVVVFHRREAARERAPGNGVDHRRGNVRPR